MKNNGFTLVELLGVITILGLIALITFPPMIKQIWGTNEAVDEANRKLIFAATEEYVNEKKNDYPLQNGFAYCVQLQTLVDAGKLKTPLYDSSTKKDLDLNRYVRINVDASLKYNYEILKDKEDCVESH